MMSSKRCPIFSTYGSWGDGLVGRSESLITKKTMAMTASSTNMLIMVYFFF